MKKIKGINKNVVHKNITFDQFKNFIFNDVAHSVYTPILNKRCISGIDDKRFQIPNSFKTLPWGSKYIENYQ